MNASLKAQKFIPWNAEKLLWTIPHKKERLYKQNMRKKKSQFFYWEKKEQHNYKLKPLAHLPLNWSYRKAELENKKSQFMVVVQT